jgi:glutathionylspermidine synthase
MIDIQTRFDAWQCTEPLSSVRHRTLVRDMNLRGCKWDTQLGDVPTLAPFALVIPTVEWRHLAALAESLSAELAALEQVLMQRSDLWPCLGLPRHILDAFQNDDPWSPAAARIVRYDFHPTETGWQISEVNGDVPGGFNESSTFARLIAENFPGCAAAGDPLEELSVALVRSAGGIARIGLLAAPGHNEDWQIVSGLGEALRQRGVEACPARPEQLIWENNRAFIRQAGQLQPLGGIYRFYQGEWLARVPASKWRPMIRGGFTPVCNPGRAILSESKRLPLLWPELNCNIPTWRHLLPQTSTPAAALRSGLSDWVLKPAYCNTGDTVIGKGWQSNGQLFLNAMKAIGNTRTWMAQRRFFGRQLATPFGPMNPCLGIYTINGRATGIYGRMSPKPVIDYSAYDVAILLRD